MYSVAGKRGKAAPKGASGVTGQAEKEKEKETGEGGMPRRESPCGTKKQNREGTGEQASDQQGAEGGFGIVVR